ncbi:MAG: hypothetical protein JWP89_3272 [Schlesneria sp.]|nr:hypothetical protein [Schlesneria sp.]
MKPSVDDLEGFARRLGTFGARAVSLDREALVFAAGQASAEPVRANVRPIRGIRLWQASTVAMTLLSVVLGSLLMWKPTPSPQIVFVEREVPEVKQTATSPPASQIDSSPQLAADQPIEITPRHNAEDARLAEAWKTRRELIAASGQSERQLATTSLRGAGGSLEQPLTRSSLLGEQSQETIQRWLKGQL